MILPQIHVNTDFFPEKNRFYDILSERGEAGAIFLTAKFFLKILNNRQKKLQKSRTFAKLKKKIIQQKKVFAL